jgi:hypothetical protein
MLRRMTKLRLLILCLPFLGFAGLGSARADDIAPTRIGRVSAVDGMVSLRPSGGEWSDSAINDPVAAGMSVRTGGQARAQLRVGADTIALSAATRIEVGRLDESATQVAVPQGRIGVHLAGLDPGSSIEIDLPHGGVWLLAAGDYDISAGDEKTPGRVAALTGSAHVVADGIDTTVATGSALALSSGSRAVAKLDGGVRDEFLAWWRPPGDDGIGPQALRFVSPDMTGYEALDAGGTWEEAEGYGEVWYPNVVAQSWAPYRYGHWRSLATWGWTWIDDMPWGFAPSHYGRWARIDDRWAWVPGPRVDHPAYAPALVAFLGTAGVGLSYPDGNGPAVAWFPLAPGEVYWPGYTSDLEVIRRINAGAVHNVAAIGPGLNGQLPAAVVNGDYRNRRFASVVPRPVFVAGRAVASSMIELPGARLDNAPLLAGSPPAGSTPVAAAGRQRGAYAQPDPGAACDNKRGCGRGSHPRCPRDCGAAWRRAFGAVRGHGPDRPFPSRRAPAAEPDDHPGGRAPLPLAGGAPRGRPSPRPVALARQAPQPSAAELFALQSQIDIAVKP